jgi:hypothetical protein
LHKGEDSVLLDILPMLLIVYCCLLRVYSVPAPVLIVKMIKLPSKLLVQIRSGLRTSLDVRMRQGWLSTSGTRER